MSSIQLDQLEVCSPLKPRMYHSISMFSSLTVNNLDRVQRHNINAYSRFHVVAKGLVCVVVVVVVVIVIVIIH